MGDVDMTFLALKNVNVVLISFFFALIFFGYNGAEAFITVFYDQVGLKQVALTAQGLAYTFILLSTLVTPWINGKIGLRNTMLVAAAVYALYIAGYATGNIPLIFVLSALNGLAIGLLWNSRNTYLLKVVEDNRDKFSSGEATGIADSARALGGTLGGLAAGWLASYLGLSNLFLVFSMVIALSLLIGFNIKPLEREATAIPFRQVFSKVTDGNVWLLMPFCLAVNSMWGISLATLSVNVSRFGLEYVGILFGLYHGGSIILATGLGRAGDAQNGRYRHLILNVALVGAIVGLLLLTVANSVWLLLLIALLFTTLFSAGNTLLNSLVGLTFLEKDWEAVQGLIRIPLSVGVVVPIVAEGFWPLYGGVWLSSFFCVLALICLRMIQEKKDISTKGT